MQLPLSLLFDKADRLRPQSLPLKRHRSLCLTRSCSPAQSRCHRRPPRSSPGRRGSTGCLLLSHVQSRAGLAPSGRGPSWPFVHLVVRETPVASPVSALCAMGCWGVSGQRWCLRAWRPSSCSPRGRAGAAALFLLVTCGLWAPCCLRWFSSLQTYPRELVRASGAGVRRQLPCTQRLFRHEVCRKR